MDVFFPDSCIEEVKGKKNEYKSACLFLKGCAYRLVNLTDNTSLLRHFKEFFAKKQYLVIVGYPGGLERELGMDISIACKVAKVPNELLYNLSKELNEPKDLYTVVGNESVLKLLISPTKEEFEKYITEVISNCVAQYFAIIYCGHGSSYGSITLKDGEYFGHDLRNLLEEVNTIVFPRMTFLLNCCYAIDFVSSLSGEDVTSILDTFAWVAEIDLNKHYEEYTQEGNKELWSKLLEKMKSEDIFRSPFRCELKNQHPIYFWPLSLGSLKSTGLLQEIYKVESKSIPDINLNLSRNFSSWYEEDNADFENKLPYKVNTDNIEVEYPTLYVLKAGYGDSTIFRWRHINILIDGGIIEKSGIPCFWDLISSLSHLNMVILTHGDVDHIGGLLPLFYRKKYEKKNGKEGIKIDKVSFVAKDEKHRDWYHVVQLQNIVKELGITLINPSQGTDIFEHEFENGDKVSFKVVWPDDCRLNKAKERLSQIKDRITLINESSLAILVSCKLKKENKEIFALFTGDADGKDIIDGVKNVYMSDSERILKSLTYVDMPHHGSFYNNHKYFLDNIKSKIIMVSTNGKKHRHPHNQTFNCLIDQIKKNNCKLYFNYDFDTYKNIYSKDYPKNDVIFSNEPYVELNLFTVGREIEKYSTNDNSTRQKLGSSPLTEKKQSKKRSSNRYVYHIFSYESSCLNNWIL